MFWLLILLAAAPLHPAIPTNPIICRTEIRFSPRGGVKDLLIREIGRAESRIRIALYGLNNPKIVDALIAAKERGADVALKLDKLQSEGKNQKVQIARLRSAGISAEISELSRLLHDKFAVFDRRRVWTGSYNWTVQAERRHRENAALLDCPEAAELYEHEWKLIEIGK